MTIKMELFFDNNSLFVKILKKLIEQHKVLNLETNAYSFTDVNLQTHNPLYSRRQYQLSFEEHSELITNVIDLCEKCGLKCNKKINFNNNDFRLVSFHYAHTQNKLLSPPTCIHVDNQCLTDINVNTFIIYSNNVITGGEFAIYDDTDIVLDNEYIFKQKEEDFKLVKKIKTYIENDDNHELYKGIIFSGDVIHNSLPLLDGERYALSVQVVVK